VQDPAAPPLTVYLLGSFMVWVNGVALPHVRSRKEQWLLALLALHAGGPVDRDWLADALWPDSSDPLANLRKSLKDLRRALGPEANRLHAPAPRSLALDLPGAEVDVLAFDAAIAKGDETSLECAVGIYRGPLLEGCAEEWVFPERQRREEAYLQALEELAAQALGSGDPAGAERWLRQAVVVDPLRESAQRALMQSLAAGGNYAAALQVYRELRLSLHRELNASPDAATQALFRTLRDSLRHLAPVTSPCYPARATPDGRITAPADGISDTQAGEPSHNLPYELTSFIGREREMEEVRRLFGTSRLLTLTGAGGCGKTRLALRVAADLLTEHADGVWLVEFAALTDPVLVPQTVAAALGVREVAGTPLIQTLAAALKPKQLLLVLDNCEHLLTACAELAEALLRSCPHLRVLATSREALGVPGEQSCLVPSLSLPPTAAGERLRVESSSKVRGQPLSDLSTLNFQLSTLLQYEAVQLFVERARLGQPAFAVTVANAAMVTQICRLLDGIPLAIEMAAARVKTLPIEQMAVRLEDRFRLLTRGSRTALLRHQTLQALIDWSYDLLSEPERVLLQRLSVFAGGWTMEAAEAVCGDSALPTRTSVSESRTSLSDPIQNPKSKIQNAGVLERLTALVEKSLVMLEAEGEGRYRLLETVRRYAQDRLLETEAEATVRGRHRDWFLGLVEQAWEGEGYGGESEGSWMERLEQEHDNLRAALAWCRTSSVQEGPRSGPEHLNTRTPEHPSPTEKGLRLGVALWWFWVARGYIGEGRERLAELLALSGAEARTATRAQALLSAGLLAAHQGDYGAARALYEESLAISQELGNKQSIAVSLHCIGAVAHNHGDNQAAWALFEESLALYRELGMKENIALELGWLGRTARGQEDYGAALAFFEQSLMLHREVGRESGIAWSLNLVANAARDQGEYEAARALQKESLALYRELRNKPGIVRALEGMAAVVAAQALPEPAARLSGAAEAFREAMGLPRPPAERAEHEHCVAAVRTAMCEGAFAAAWAEGRALTLEDAVRYALEEV
jgi:predicted ATPase/DNA-binding SARP family transcriptional activator